MTNPRYLEIDEVLNYLKLALDRQQPFSLIRIGDGENLILSQDTVWPIEKVLQERWAVKANLGQKGLFLPNTELRDAVAEAVRKATISGILPYDDESIKAPTYMKRELTDQVFAHYALSPALTCHACLNRYLAQTPAFWDMLKDRRILLVTRTAAEVKPVLEAEPYGLHIAHTLAFHQYEQMHETLQWITSHQDEFDIALFSCGVNAVVLAQKTAELTGKVGIDFGKAINIVMFGKAN
ncbi:GT-D fold domain-containing glycosyltransferase [Paenibacillus sp. 1-18]|uniref:GT-D fold domain-containing glycosyltransferase n=1 Tax=Paenibacillus sp. 1-18 TaxID=1333846 RepID=UPI000472BC16|nr:GT-D fold domain-containing glycosyltransferase [Paenibacillus sp. 1-18]